jgi:pimeloyl-ACP methyl ester carboxylesterase
MPDWSEARCAGSGVVLNVRQGGKGPVVLLLHGFPDSRRLWNDVAPRLAAAGYRYLAPDLRGYGRSEAPDHVSDYTLGHVVSDLRALIARLNRDEPLCVIGHDWGAVAGWCLALEHPQLVRAHVALSVGHPREYALAGFEQKLKGAYTLAWQVPGVAERWLRRNRYAGLRGWGRQHPRIEPCIADLSRPGRLTAALNWYRANFRRVLLGSWSDCRVPTLGVWSDRDHFLAEDQMRGSERRMAAPWRYERVRNAGHWLPLEQPDRVAELAVEWFQQHAAAASRRDASQATRSA